MVFCTFGPNLVILAWMGGELWCRQAQNRVNLDFQVKFDLEGQGRSVHKTLGTLTKVFCIFCPNLVVLAWTGPELSRGQASDWHTDRQTDTHTDAGNDNTQRPKLASGKNDHHRTWLIMPTQGLWFHTKTPKVTLIEQHQPSPCQLKWYSYFYPMESSLCHWLKSLQPSDAKWQHIYELKNGSGNGLLSDGTKPLPEPILTYRQ